jgi:hypothetical protein
MRQILSIRDTLTKYNEKEVHARVDIKLRVHKIVYIMELINNLK